jgi:hypothetical protein
MNFFLKLDLSPTSKTWITNQSSPHSGTFNSTKTTTACAEVIPLALPKRCLTATARSDTPGEHGRRRPFDGYDTQDPAPVQDFFSRGRASQDGYTVMTIQVGMVRTGPVGACESSHRRWYAWTRERNIRSF